tara:strand:+ start:749 stop:883 length:135 start_codon:yes stop_codon:yes gene_type:complete
MKRSKDLFLTLREKELEKEKTAEKVLAAKLLMYLRNFNLNENEK